MKNKLQELQNLHSKFLQVRYNGNPILKKNDCRTELIPNNLFYKWMKVGYFIGEILKKYEK